MKWRYLIWLVFALGACRREESVPKPEAYLRLEYPPHAYESARLPFPFTFDKSVHARPEITSDSTFNLYYPLMKARLHFTYSPVRGNLTRLLTDAEKLTYKHAVKADEFIYEDYANPRDSVFARIHYVTGNAASPLQIQITDSTRHFVTASLYFRAVPNYDSIRPPLEYLKKDVKRLVESWKWLSSRN
ncbi:MAG: gliding motility lipoprotein GldD [Chlorobi bacterium]|nr:gliding motility lipoprotein GldD [Chlorobiota bacterium]